MIETIEILSTDFLDQYRPLIEEQKKLARFIGIGTGWHYPLDWSWIITHLGKVEGKRILDAGAGLGVLQWYLAEQGAEVISVDRESRACIPFHLRRRYRIQGLRSGDLLSPLQMMNPFHRFALNPKKVKGLARSVLSLSRPRIPGRAPGNIIIYNQDLKNLVDIPSNSIDAIISVSALEHNPPEDLPIVVGELERVLKPSGAMIVTLAAGRERDWLHEPSRGWCYTDATLRKVFGLSPAARSNYDQFDVLFEALKECHELRDQLAGVYYRSKRNGMPGGKWDPQYQPVGVIKIKANES